MAAVSIYLSGQDWRVITTGVAVFVVFVLAFLWLLYQSIGRALDQRTELTHPITIIFGPDGLVVAGPNYRSELAWSWFKGFSEDATYFYLHLANTGFDSVLPKSAFSPEQQDDFRLCAQSCHVSVPMTGQ